MAGIGRQTPQRSGIGRETLLEVQNWSVDLPGRPELVGRPSWRFGSGREMLPEVRPVRETLPEVWKWS